MSNWQPGKPVVTVQDELEWQEWRKTRKLESQKRRRAKLTRIDYYPSKAALEAIEGRAVWNAPVSIIIDELILAGLPE